MPRLRWLVTAGVAAVLLAGVGGWLLGDRFGTRGAGAAQGGCDVTAVAARILPAVVTVAVEGAEASGTGSGVIVDPDGTIITNDHVIAAAGDGAGRVSVRLDDGSVHPAEIIGQDPATDLAVLNIDHDQRLPSVRWGDSGALVVGQPVVAAGAPLGLYGTITSGVVSALGRNVPVPSGDGSTVLVGAIQTDASINPGNSGGALVTCDSELVGINTAIATVPSAEGGSSSGSVGIGFAVPGSVARPLLEQLLERGSVEHPSFGMETVPVARRGADRAEVGLLITKIIDGGTAAAGGLRVDDVITRIEGEAELHADTLAHRAARSAVGDSVVVDYVRAGENRRTTLTLKSG